MQTVFEMSNLYFLGKNKKNILMSSTENFTWNRVSQAKFVADDIQIFFFFFSEKTSHDISC